MANYSLVINSQFKPFSYAELLAPVHATTEAHEKLADKYDSLSLLASPWQNRLNKEVDKNAYATVEDYVGALESQRDVLESYGLTPDARRQFSLLRGRYARDIIPVEEGWKMKQADITRQQQIQDRTGGLTIFDRDARTTSVDDYMSGNVKDFNQVNLETVRNYGTMSGSAYSKRKINIEEGNAFGGDYLKMVKTHGVSAEEAAQIMKAAMDRSNKYPEVQALLDEMRNSVGYDNFDAAGKKKIDSALIKGFVDGLVYDQQVDIRNNWRAEKAVDLGNQITLENVRAKNERDLLDYKYSLENPSGPGVPTAGDTGFEGSILGKNADTNQNEAYKGLFAVVGSGNTAKYKLYKRDYYKKLFGIDIVKADGSLMTREEFRKAIDAEGTKALKALNRGGVGYDEDKKAILERDSLIRSRNSKLKEKYYRFIDTLHESGVGKSAKVYTSNGAVYIDVTDKLNKNTKFRSLQGRGDWNAYGTIKLDLMDTAKDVLVGKISSSTANVQEVTGVTANRKGVTIKTRNPEEPPIFVKEFPSENKITDEHRKVLNIQYSPHGKKVLVETVDKDGKPHWYSTEHLINSSYDPKLAELGSKLTKAVDEGKIADANAYKAGIVKLLNATTGGYGAVNLNTTSNSQ